MTDTVDVVVVSYNSRETLRDCVAPLAGLPGVEVIVVDNDSPDRSLEAIADLPVHRIASGRNGGFGFGCNIGAAAGEAPFILFLNPDARIAFPDVERLTDVLRTEPQVAIVGPRISGTDGALFPSMRRLQRLGSIWATALFLHRLLRRAPWANEIVHERRAYDAVAYPEWVSGACMLVRRSVLEAVGGLDVGFFLYGEDMDLCARIAHAGYRVRFEPTAHAVHEGGHSAPRSSLLPVLARSRMRFAQRHASAAGAALQALGLAVGALTHLVAAAPRPAQRRGHAAALRAIVTPRRHHALSSAGAGTKP